MEKERGITIITTRRLGKSPAVIFEGLDQEVIDIINKQKEAIFIQYEDAVIDGVSYRVGIDAAKDGSKSKIGYCPPIKPEWIGLNKQWNGVSTKKK